MKVFRACHLQSLTQVKFNWTKISTELLTKPRWSLWSRTLPMSLCGCDVQVHLNCSSVHLLCCNYLLWRRTSWRRTSVPGDPRYNYSSFHAHAGILAEMSQNRSFLDVFCKLFHVAYPVEVSHRACKPLTTGSIILTSCGAYSFIQGCGERTWQGAFWILVMDGQILALSVWYCYIYIVLCQ